MAQDGNDRSEQESARQGGHLWAGWLQARPFIVLLLFAGFVVAIWHFLLKYAELMVDNVFIIVALIPSMLVLGMVMLGHRRALIAYEELLRCYRGYTRRYATTRGLESTHPLFYPAEVGEEEFRRQRPHLAQLLLGTLGLAVPFLIVAAFSEALILEGEGRQILPVHGPDAFFDLEGVTGAVYAGYGVYTYTLVRLFFRLNAAALSFEFLVTLTFRALIVLVLGLVVGQSQLFSELLSMERQSAFVYFAIGAFPGWALQALRRRSKAILRPVVSGEKELSLEYVDGINEQVSDRLEEMGISNIQHMANSDPGELSVRLFHPLNRIIDWIDQALLICHLRDKITCARELGIRGAIDMQRLVRLARQAEPDAGAREASSPGGASRRPGQQARAVLAELARRGELELDALYLLGESLTDDLRVDFLAHLCRRGIVSGSRRGLERSIDRALEDCGIPLAGEAGPGRQWDPRWMENPNLQERFLQALSAELSRLSLSWDGGFESLRVASSLEEFHDLLIQEFEMRPLQPHGGPSALEREAPLHH
jgi:hypothetical protein